MRGRSNGLKMPTDAQARGSWPGKRSMIGPAACLTSSSVKGLPCPEGLASAVRSLSSSTGRSSLASNPLALWLRCSAEGTSGADSPAVHAQHDIGNRRDHVTTDPDARVGKGGRRGSQQKLDTCSICFGVDRISHFERLRAMRLHAWLSDRALSLPSTWYNVLSCCRLQQGTHCKQCGPITQLPLHLGNCCFPHSRQGGHSVSHCPHSRPWGEIKFETVRDETQARR